MGGEGRAFSSHGLQVKRGRGCPEAAWHPQIPHQQEEHVHSARAWLGWHRNGACGWGRRSPSGHVSQCLSPLDGRCHPAQTPLVQRCLGAASLGRAVPAWPGLRPLAGSAGSRCCARACPGHTGYPTYPMIWDLSGVPGASWVLPLSQSHVVQGAGHLPGQDYPLALNAALYFVPWLLEEGTEMLGGSHGPSHSDPARLVCVLGEWDVCLLSVRLLQGTSVLSVPPVTAVSGAWGWVRWVPAPLGAIWPQDPLGLELGGARHSHVAAVLSGCSAVRLSARSDLSFSLSVFSPPLSLFPSPTHVVSFLLSSSTLCCVSVSFSLLPTSSWWERY